ncbi:MAG: hypothetical protein D6719_12835 [Candidatus Dadabacteria bacterium]|nr:MAG: hypothetical protein D6719_12835 [Candidatus Dadabacteria bacterium]
MKKLSISSLVLGTAAFDPAYIQTHRSWVPIIKQSEFESSDFGRKKLLKAAERGRRGSVSFERLMGN